MTLNHEIFVRDPKQTEIPNTGVAKVKTPEDDLEWKTLKWELESFVCEGEYARGIDRILGSFLKSLSQTEQPAVWVSGFYGSGKSHLVKVLEHLWRDDTLPSGESARSLATLTSDIDSQLRELTLAGRREGGLWSAAGTLGAGSSESPRLAFLSVLFASAGLPEQYGKARFVLWLKQNGYYDGVVQHVRDAEKDFERELSNLYVSPFLHRALMDVIGTDLAPSVAEVSPTLQAQFPPTPDLTNQDLLNAFREVLELRSDKDGKLPLTLIVLDEMQQYIGEDVEKAQAVQHIVEGCSSEFGSRVLFVVTGQSALTATPTLQRLVDRFAVQVALSDTDVEAVTRKVILQKKPSAVDEVKSELSRHSGEIARQLAGTKVGPTGADTAHLVADYPLLPARRRFWERALRAIDKAGKAGVLRTQLRIVHEATRRVADDPLGHVVGADFVYDMQFGGMLQSGVLLREIDELIRGLRDGTGDGELKSRACALIFLIAQLPQEGFGDIGIRATSAVLADLLIQDLENDGPELRRRVPELLEELAEGGSLLKIGDEYRLQTEEGAEWTKDFNQRRASIRDDALHMSSLRNEWLTELVGQQIGSIQLRHGKSNTPRLLAPSWDQELPSSQQGEVPVWIRDEWNVNESAVRQAAAQAGTEDPVVHVFLRRFEADAIRDALASWAAARDTISQRALPQTEPGKAAKLAMETRAESEQVRVKQLFDGVTASAVVFQSGGSVVDGPSLRDAIEQAANASLDRLFPKFRIGDESNWGKVVEAARSGADSPLEHVGHSGPASGHRVCAEVAASISAAGTEGSEVQRKFTRPPYGWPKDAINGAILALYADGQLRAEKNNKPYDGPSSLPPAHIASARLIREDEPPTQDERFRVKGLLTDAGIDYAAGQEARAIDGLLQYLLDLADRAGGEPPLPVAPGVTHIKELRTKAGNEQFRAVAQAFDQLQADLAAWDKAATARDARLARWQELDRLLHHARSLEAAAVVESERHAILEGRQLLQDPDPVAPLIDRLTDELREQLLASAEMLRAQHEHELEQLQSSEEWSDLSDEDWRRIVDEVGLQKPAVPDVSTDEELLRALDESPLDRWTERIELLKTKAARARELAAKKLQPKAVSMTLPPATLTREADVTAYLDRARTLLMEHIDAGHPVVL